MLGLGNEWQVIDCRFDENDGVFLEINEGSSLFSVEWDFEFTRDQVKDG